MARKRRGQPPDEADPWWGRGLRFECRPDCGACCTNHGDSTYVYLDGDDASRLAAFLGLEPDEFHRRYTAGEDGSRYLRDVGPDCVFLDQFRCTVHPARPTQCRTFPFWPQNLVDRSRWEKLREFCPGVDRGPLHGPLEIRAQLEAHDE